MNHRTIKLGATLGAAALAIAAPAVASAQDFAPNGGPSGSYAMPSMQMSQSDQLDRLQRLGFIGASSVLVAPVGPRLASNFEALPADQLRSTLDNVKVTAGPKGLISTLRVYLDSRGISPDRIAGVMVGSNNVVIAYRGERGADDPTGAM